MESKLLFFFIVIMNKHLQKSTVLFFYVFLFLKDKDSQCIQVSLSDKATFRGISSECNSISSFFFCLFVFHSFHAVTEGLDNGT